MGSRIWAVIFTESIDYDSDYTRADVRLFNTEDKARLFENSTKGTSIVSSYIKEVVIE